MRDDLRDEQTNTVHEEPVSKPRNDSVGGWLAPIIVTLFTIIWTMAIYVLVGDRPVDWKYGVTPYIPGESIISTQHVPRGIAPRQIELPPAVRNRPYAEPSSK